MNQFKIKYDATELANASTIICYCKSNNIKISPLVYNADQDTYFIQVDQYNIKQLINNLKKDEMNRTLIKIATDMVNIS